MTFRSIEPFKSLAIVGMSVSWAGCDCLEDFTRMIYEGRAQYASLAGLNERGSKALGQIARQSLRDAGLDPETSPLRIAVMTAGAPGKRAEWSWAASFSDLSGEANPLAAAIEQAERLIGADVAQAVVFAAISDCDVPEGTPLAPADGSGLGFDREVHGWRMGDGAGAVVLMPYDRAQHEGRQVYALVRGMASTAGIPSSVNQILPAPPSLEDVRGCCRSALDQSGVPPEAVGYVEAFASGVDALDGIEIAGLVQTYRQPEQNLTTALGSIQANTGYLGAAAGIFGLIHAALCLCQRMIPGIPGWSAPKLPALWRGGPFYIPLESRTWFEPQQDGGRAAGLDIMGLNGSFAHLILVEPRENPVRLQHALARDGFYLIPLVAENQAELVSVLQAVRRAMIAGSPIAQAASHYYQMARNRQEAAFALSIVGHDADEAVREIDLALKAIPGVFERSAEWQTPLGSYFSVEPAGREGGVALVYPGAFNSYPGVGQDLFYLFPELFNQMSSVTADLGRIMRERLLYPRSLTASSKDDLAALEAQLLGDPIAMLISGTALAILYTNILRSVFKVQPQASFGYSLGENAMMFATGVWKQGDQASQRLAESEAFRVRLAGPQLAIREYWGIPVNGGMEDSPLWSNYLVMAPPERVQDALAHEPHVYMTHINTPRQVVIGGDPQACKRVLESLQASSLEAPFDYALHCQAMRSEYDALARLHDWPVEANPGLTMYTAANYDRMPIDQHEISQNIAHMLTSPLDFPRLVQKVYAEGARVFIEAGAGSNCARWIDESLKGSPHLALSMNRRGTDDYSTLIRTLARLHSHRVPMDLSRLYESDGEKVRL